MKMKKVVISFVLAIIMCNLLFTGLLFAEQKSLLPSERIAFKTHDGTVYGNYHTYITFLSSNKVTISSGYIRYCLTNDGTSQVIEKKPQNADLIDNNEIFTYVKIGNNKFSLKANNGKYISSKNGILYADTENNQIIITKIPIDIIRIKANNNKYLQFVSNQTTQDGYITANTSEIYYDSGYGSFEFGLMRLDNNSVMIECIRGKAGSYERLCAPTDVNSQLVANNKDTGKQQTFKYIDQGHDRFSLKTFTGNFVSSKNEECLIANKTRIGANEIFKMIMYDKSYGLR